jgi:hypothetical protein
VSGSLQSGAISLGQWLLPKITDVAKWFGGVVNFLKGKSILSKIASDAVIGLFVSAVVLKLGKGISSVFSAGASLIKGVAGVVSKVVGTAAASTPLDLNTAALNRLTAVIETHGLGGGGGGGGKGGSTVVKDIEKILGVAGPAGVLGVGAPTIAGLAVLFGGLLLGAMYVTKYFPKNQPTPQEANLQAYNEYEALVKAKLAKIAAQQAADRAKHQHHKPQTHKTVVKVKHHVKVH